MPKTTSIAERRDKVFIVKRTDKKRLRLIMWFSCDCEVFKEHASEFKGDRNVLINSCL